jgi:hypothetical protein
MKIHPLCCTVHPLLKWDFLLKIIHHRNWRQLRSHPLPAYCQNCHHHTLQAGSKFNHSTISSKSSSSSQSYRTQKLTAKISIVIDMKFTIKSFSSLPTSKLDARERARVMCCHSADTLPIELCRALIELCAP